MRVYALSATIGFVVLAVGCSSPVSTGYLDRQALLQPGQYLDGVWCSDRVGQAPAYSHVRVVSVEAHGVQDAKGVSASDAVSWLRTQLMAGDESNHDDVFLMISDKGPTASLELVITEMTPGSVAARFWAGEFGAGHASVQVEGKLTDATEGVLLCELVQRTRASGAAGLRDLGGDSGPAMVKQMLGMVARALRDERRVKLQGEAAT